MEAGTYDEKDIYCRICGQLREIFVKDVLGNDVLCVCIACDSQLPTETNDNG